jgi:hypothetical protein
MISTFSHHNWQGFADHSTGSPSDANPFDVNVEYFANKAI